MKTGSKHSAETRARMSQSQRGNANALGMRHTPEARALMSHTRDGRPGTPHSEETRAKISEKQRARNPDSFGNIRREMRELTDYCSICGRHEDELSRKLGVDHDHSCCVKGCRRCVRGMLCGPCNTAIGLLQDNPAVIDAAARYLREWHDGRR